MARWLHAEYRDFHDVPRAMVCRNEFGTFYFLSHFDTENEEYAGHYEVYRIPELRESDLCASWFGLETRALARLPDIPVNEFPFDAATHRFLDYDPIAPLLGG
jgi:hypothetical protein